MDRPILFSGAMVKAILTGSKSQTRRIVKCTPGVTVRGDGIGHWPYIDVDAPAACPYGQPGDRLWVRETFFAFGRWETRYSAKKGRDEWHFVDMTLETGCSYSYAADGLPRDFKKGNQRGSVTPTWWRRPAIFMPRAASRITLEITGVRVDRLQSMSADDAYDEGTDNWAAEVQRNGNKYPNIVAAYRGLWESINGAGSWDANPWVWVVAFKRITE